MAYYNPYFEDRTDGVESAPNYTFEQFLDGKPPFYFLAFLRHNYAWTQNEGLDSFAFRLSPCCVFWHDRLYERHSWDQLKDFLLTVMDKAGLLDEPVMIMIEYSRKIINYKVKTHKTLIDSDGDTLVVDIPPEDRITEETWRGKFIERDIKMFSKNYELRDGIYQVKEKHGIIDKTGKETDRWMRFIVFDPKSE